MWGRGKEEKMRDRRERDGKVVIRVHFCAHMLLSLSNTVKFLFTYQENKEVGSRVSK